MSSPNLYTRITDHLREGGVVQVTTYTKSTLYEPKHLGLFRAPGSRGIGAYVRRGKSWDYLSPLGGISVRFGRIVERAL